MLKIQNLPEELLCAIFNDVDIYDLQQCQKVCQSWYIPAHVALLRDIELNTIDQVRQFIDSIDQNPSPIYLNAVREIRVGPLDESLNDPLVTDETIKKLFRFPNLEKIDIESEWISSIILNDSRIGEDLINSCHHIKVFDLEVATECEEPYQNLVYKMRNNLTRLKATKFYDVSQYGDEQAFISSFPNLQEVCNRGGYLENLENALPIIEQLRNLKQIEFGPGDDREDVVERYMETKTEEQQKQLIENFSRISTVAFINVYGPCVSTVKCISQYFTGMDFFSTSSVDNRTWTDAQYQAFNEDILRIMCTLDEGYFLLQAVSNEVLLGCFNDIIQKVFYEIPPQCTNVRRILHVLLKNSNEQWRHDLPADLEVNTAINGYATTRIVKITISKEIDTEILESMFSSLLPLEDIAVFAMTAAENVELELDENEQARFGSLLQKIFEQMPALQDMTVHPLFRHFISYPEIVEVE
jgi:hypothetical protein